MEKEKIIQIDGEKALTNRGRVFERYIKPGSFGKAWTLLDAPLELAEPEDENS